MTGAVDLVDIGASSDLNDVHEDKMAYRAELNAMGIEAEAEEDEKETKSAKNSGKKKEKSKNIKCEEYLDISTLNPGQLAAIKRIGTREGLEQIKKWIEQAMQENQDGRLINLLAQLYHADVNMHDMMELKLGIIIGNLGRHGRSKDSKECAKEIKDKWTRQMQAGGLSSGTPSSLEEEDSEASKKSGIAIPPRPIPINKAPLKASAVPSDFFSQSLTGGGSPISKPIVRKRPEVNPPSHQPIKKSVNDVAPSSGFKISIPKDQKAEMDGGPDPNRVPASDVPRKRRRIHFSDDKGLELVHIREIESCLANRMRGNNDMKHADAQHESQVLKQNMKMMNMGEEKDDEEEAIQEETVEYRVIPYMTIDPKPPCKELVDDEIQRTNEILAGFYLPDAPSANPMEDNIYVSKNSDSIQKIPLETLVVEQSPEPMEVQENTKMKSPEIQILQDIDIHGGQKKDAKLNQDFTMGAEELVILEQDPAKVNPSKVNMSVEDIKSILAKVKNAPSQMTSIPPPTLVTPPLQSPTINQSQFASNPQPMNPQSGVIDLVEVPVDIHAGQQGNPRFSFPQRPQFRPRAPGTSGNVCQYFLKGTCTFGNNCFNRHVVEPSPGAASQGTRFQARGANFRPRFDNFRPNAPIETQQMRFNPPPQSIPAEDNDERDFG
ncbi:hypothetical protein FO519_003335 [Halicephalobus sp. NKZ332]|nr:hypothetical protein FO519_003335 [Halicephalobus sp. NKZ332]